MDWFECNNKRLVKQTNIDKNMILSLKDSSKRKLITAKRIIIDEITSSSVISLFYDSLRELLESIALSKGFKIYNHECYTSFIREILKQDKISNEFDKFRKIRNSINYYGKSLDIEETKKITSNIESLIHQIYSF